MSNRVIDVFAAVKGRVPQFIYSANEPREAAKVARNLAAAGNNVQVKINGNVVMAGSADGEIVRMA
jgi:hypothetical protein